MYKAVKEAVDRARSGGGPTLVECETYRIGAHSSSDDPTRYRDEKEVDVWKKRDPLDLMRSKLTGWGIWTAKDEDEAKAKFAMLGTAFFHHDFAAIFANHGVDNLRAFRAQ